MRYNVDIHACEGDSFLSGYKEDETNSMGPIILSFYFILQEPVNFAISPHAGIAH